MAPFFPLIAADVVYSAACVIVGARSDAPLWLRWPHILWARTLGGRPLEVGRMRPDYAKIRRLERELGVGEDSPAP